MADEQAVLPIRLSSSVIDDLTGLVECREHIVTIVEAAERTSAAPSIRTFSTHVAQQVKEVSPAAVFDVLVTLVNIRRMQLSREVDASRMVDILTASLEKHADEDWRKNRLEGWKEARESIVHALESIRDDQSLFISEKAETLAYSDQNILTSHRIITELRPVFDAAGEKIRETLILHKLLIEYYDGISPPKRISLTLDSADIAALRTSCQRAEGKAKATLVEAKVLNPIELPEKRGSP